MLKKRRSRGRPRKFMVPRYKSGRAKPSPQVDDPGSIARLNELVALLGEETVSRLRNSKSGLLHMDLPIGVMYELGIIEEVEKKAGLKFQALHHSIMAMAELKIFPRASDMNQVYGRPTGEPPDELLERHAEAYDRARKALLRQGRRVFDQVVNVCAYGRFPGWFERQKLGFPRKGDHRRYEDLRSGLSELAKVFGL